jgi:hypothetical protein
MHARVGQRAEDRGGTDPVERAPLQWTTNTEFENEPSPVGLNLQATGRY